MSLTFVVIAALSIGAFFAFIRMLISSDKAAAVQAANTQRQNVVLQEEIKRAKAAKDLDPSKLSDDWLRPRD